MKLRKKLIEVALPLEAINKASAHEKMPGIGPHPRGLHLWWARRPLAAARAVIFSQMVDDPSEYVDTLKSDPKLLRRAESELKKRHKVWQEATAELARAEAAGISAPPPGAEPGLDEIVAEQERDRLFKIIEELVLWENTTNERVLDAARAEIWQSWRRTCADNADHPRAKELFDRNKLPAFHDPFTGGGALPIEAQRLGLDAHASDLNPVAVLINKAMIEIPPKFAGMAPVNPEWQSKSDAEKALRDWERAEGLATDVRYYGRWMREEAEKRIGHLYPKAEITEEIAKDRPDLQQYAGKKLPVIAWIWARTVKSPNPAFRNVDVPLASTFMLSTKPGKEAYVEPVVESTGYRFTTKVGKPTDPMRAKSGTKLSGASFRCLMSDSAIEPRYIRSEGQAGRLGVRLMAIVAEGNRGRVYLSPTKEAEGAAAKANPTWTPDIEFFKGALGFRIGNYGMSKWSDLFTSRQLHALVTLTDLVQEARDRVRRDALAVDLSNDETSLSEGGISARAYAEAVALYLAFAVDRCASFSNTCTRWGPGNQKVMNIFGRQAIPMIWDFADAAILNDTVGGLAPATDFIGNCIEKVPAEGFGIATQQDAATTNLAADKIVSTDPPYYDNVGYADLSDFFYVWLRRSMRGVFPDLLTTVTVPKSEELVATPLRHGGKDKAEAFFLAGMTRAMERLATQSHLSFPITIYYAFKQAENNGDLGITRTGWETFLDAVIRAGFAITGTWPMRSEQEVRMRGQSSNALASNIILVGRSSHQRAPMVTRREFINALKSELPNALRHLQRGNIAPVDLAQAAIGPGMAVYTRYEKVLDAEGKPLTVRDALSLINQTLDTVLAEQEGDFDADTRWALAWFEEFGFGDGEYGRAETLSKAKNTSVDGIVEAGIAKSGHGKVRLLKPEELPVDWTPEGDKRLTVWDMVHHLIRTLEKDGEAAAAQIVAKLGAKAETARELCYRLYTLCERKKRASEALSYNALVQSWPEIIRLARESSASGTTQTELFG